MNPGRVSPSGVFVGGVSVIQGDITFEDINTVAATQITIDFATLKSNNGGTCLIGADFPASVAFVGAGITALTCRLQNPNSGGVLGSVLNLISWDDLLTIDDGRFAGDNWAGGIIFRPGDTIQLVFDATGANLDQLTAGSGQLRLVVATLPRSSSAIFGS